ncbi:MAG: ferric reductase-like transmembrane domain-containing protein [Pseudomonadota bacterium]
MISISSLKQHNTFNEKLIISGLSCIPFMVWLISTGDIFSYFFLKVPAGQILYIFSKLAGLYAYYFMALQLIIGFQGRKSQYFSYHPALGILTTLTIVAHLGLFITGASLKTKHVPIEILWPTFSNGYYKSSISYGVIAAYFLLLIITAGFLQKKIPVFKIIHRFAPIVVLLGWIHSFNIGTETRSIPTMTFYIVLFCIALYMFIKKLLRA